jgi:hypothetical protein
MTRAKVAVEDAAQAVLLYEAEAIADRLIEADRETARLRGDFAGGNLLRFKTSFSARILRLVNVPDGGEQQPVALIGPPGSRSWPSILRRHCSTEGKKTDGTRAARVPLGYTHLRLSFTGGSPQCLQPLILRFSLSSRRSARAPQG